MIEEALKYLHEQSVAAVMPRTITRPTEPFGITQPDGSILWLDGAVASRDHKAMDLQTVIAFAARFHETGGDAVWYSPEAVVAVLDDHDARRNTVTLPVGLSPQMAALRGMGETKKYTQRDLIYLLRTVFRDSMGPTGDLIGILRQVKFESVESGASQVAHGKSSVGKSIRSEVTGLSALPEYVTLSVPAFSPAVPPVYQPVECVLEPDSQTATFQFFPVPGAVDRALVAALAELEVVISQRLAAAECAAPVYCGRPV